MKRFILLLCLFSLALPIAANARLPRAKAKRGTSVVSKAAQVNAAVIAPKGQRMTAAEARCWMLASKVTILQRALRDMTDAASLEELVQAAREVRHMQVLTGLVGEERLPGIEAAFAKTRACTGCVSTKFNYSGFISDMTATYNRMNDLLARINERAAGEPDCCVKLGLAEITASGGYNIDEPGVYCLCEDVNITTQPIPVEYGLAPAAITITSPGVTLDLCGHTLSKDLGLAPYYDPYAIGVLVYADGVTVKNGVLFNLSMGVSVGVYSHATEPRQDVVLRELIINEPVLYGVDVTSVNQLLIDQCIVRGVIDEGSSYDDPQGGGFAIQNDNTIPFHNVSVIMQRSKAMANARDGFVYATLGADSTLSGGVVSTGNVALGNKSVGCRYGCLYTTGYTACFVSNAAMNNNTGFEAVPISGNNLSISVFLNNYSSNNTVANYNMTDPNVVQVQQNTPKSWTFWEDMDPQI